MRGWRGFGRLAGAAVPLLALGLFAPGAAAAPGLTLGSFELQGSNGYAIEVAQVSEGNSPPELAVSANRRGLSASYVLMSGGSTRRMRADLGPIGSIDLEFQRRKREVERPEKGCVWIAESGLYRGSFSFAGEGGYTSAARTAVAGGILHLPNGFCGFGSFGGLRPNLPDRRFHRGTGLQARSREAGRLTEFDATVGHRRGPARFSARTREQVGPITVTRAASASLKGHSIPAGKRPRRVRIEPPAPFEGSALYLNPASAPPTWTGSLRVSLPGLADVPLAGAGFAARLCPNLHPLRSCKVAAPPAAQGHAR